MLRRALVERMSRRCFAAAATAQQKRALNKEQITGTVSASATSGSDALPLNIPPSGTSGTTGSSNVLPMAALGFIAAGSAYYYYSTTTAETSKVPEIDLASNDVSAPKKDIVSEDATPATSSDTDGNRVLSIAVPEKMQNTTISSQEEAISQPSHPESGNRVTSLGNKSTSTSTSNAAVLDETMTVSALQALKDSTTLAATQAVVQSHQSLWTALDESYIADLDALSASQLKARVVQLATELKDRTKWEAVRLKEFLAMKERDTSEKYLELMQKQRLEFEDLFAKRLREQQNEMSTQLYHALQEKEATIQSVLNTALEAQQKEHNADKAAFEEIITTEVKSSLDVEYGKRMEEYKSQVAQDLQQKVLTFTALEQKIKQLQEALEASKSSKEGSLRAHRLSAAALALAEKLETNAGAAVELAALKLAAGNVGVISTACATIPDAVKSGVPTLPELQARFARAAKMSRQAALVPAGRPGLEGQIAGMVFATLKYPPNTDDPALESDNAEYLLARAQKHVELGELEHSVEQLDKLTGQPAFTISDWKKDAINRISVEKALKVIKLECALLNESCLEGEE